MSAPLYWPDDLVSPDSPGWERKGIDWLLDRCPSEFRAYSVLRTQPSALALVALDQIRSDIEGIRNSYRTARSSLTLEAAQLSEVMSALDKEGVRLVRLLRSAEVVCDRLNR